jgi:CRP-like cAMP-binding protein
MGGVSDHKPASETWRLPADLVAPWHQLKSGRRQHVSAGTTLYSQGEPNPYFYIVLSGRVEVSMLREEGTRFVIEIMGRGAVCGEAAAIDGLSSFSTAEVIEDAELLRIDPIGLTEAFRDDRALALSLMRVFATKQRIMSLRAQHLSAPSPEVRIGELLLRLGQTYGRPNGAGVLIPVSLTHEQIAGMTGTSRVTVTRSLKRLRESGAIGIAGGLITILDSAVLQAGEVDFDRAGASRYKKTRR